VGTSISFETPEKAQKVVLLLLSGGNQCHPTIAKSKNDFGIMAIGILTREDNQTVKDHLKQSYKSTSTLIERFSQEFGTTICDELIDVRMRDSDARRTASEKGIFTNVCPAFVEKVVELVLDIFPD